MRSAYPRRLYLQPPRELQLREQLQRAASGLIRNPGDEGRVVPAVEQRLGYVDVQRDLRSPRRPNLADREIADGRRRERFDDVHAGPRQQGGVLLQVQRVRVDGHRVATFAQSRGIRDVAAGSLQACGTSLGTGAVPNPQWLATA